MSKNKKSYVRNSGGNRRGHQPERHISVRAVRREQPDLRKLAQALVSLAQAQAEADAQAEHDAVKRRTAVGDGGQSNHPDEPTGSQEVA